jgi:hypothetical protein
MDGRQFDEITRDFLIPTRRSVIAAAATAVLTALIGRGAADDTLARRKQRKANHKKPKQKPHQKHESDRVQASAKKTKKKRCKGGRSRCGKRCVDLKTDPAHCGACGNGCGADGICQGGKCVLGCGGGQTECGDRCVNLQSDHGHCGACGSACGFSQVCEDRACVAGCTVCVSGCQFTAIQPAVDAAPDGEPILIAPGTYDADLDIHRNVTLRRCGDDGEVTLRNSSNRERAVTIRGGVTVTLEDLTISRNPTDDFGGGIINHGTLNLDRCAVRGWVRHTDDPLSGGVDNRGEAMLTNCVITENAPAGVWNRGPATRAALVDTTIEANEHWGVSNRDGDLTATGCTFKDNGGTGLFTDNENRRPTVVITDSVFEGNKGNQGGAVFNGGGEMTVRDSSFRGNGGGTEGGAIVSFGTLTLERCQIHRNTARAVGGGLVLTGSATIADCDISENQSGPAGGGIICHGGVISCDDNGCTGGSRLTVTDSTIRDNSAAYPASISTGGGVQIDGWCAATFTNCTISGNTIKDHGGGVNVSANGEAHFENCTINNNRATGDFTPVGAEGRGIYNEGRVTFRSGAMSEIKGNTAYAGGGIYNDGGPFNDGGELTIASCAISENEADTGGGGIYSLNGTVTFIAGGGSSVTGNTAGISGGGIALRQAATIALNDTVVSDNAPDNCSAGSPIPGCTG